MNALAMLIAGVPIRGNAYLQEFEKPRRRQVRAWRRYGRRQGRPFPHGPRVYFIVAPHQIVAHPRTVEVLLAKLKRAEAKRRR